MDGSEALTRLLGVVEERRQSTISFLTALIAERSLPGHEWAVQQLIREHLLEMGLRVDVWEPDWEALRNHPGHVPVDRGYEKRPNVVGIWPGSGGGRSLLFNGHVDVVPADPENWSTHPWHAKVKQGRLYGRGASDMKSGLAAMTGAVDAVLAAGFKPRGKIFLQYVVDEEYSGNGTLACIQRGYSADAGICCEASDLEVQPATTGSMWFKITVRGKSASMSRRWEAVSAIEKGYQVCQYISELEEHRIETVAHPLYPRSQGSLACFVGQFEAGTYPSAPPASCTLWGRMGTLPGEDAEAAQQQLREFVLEKSRLDAWLARTPPEIEFSGYFAEPAEISKDDPICRVLCESSADVLGAAAPIIGHDGAADSRFLNKYAHTPTVLYGPGRISQMHADDEWVEIDDVIKATKVLAATIIRWCGIEEG